MSGNRVFLRLLLLPLGVALSAAALSSAHADECRPYDLRIWPYRIVLDAPPTAKPGESLTYRIDYGRENRASVEPFGFVFQWSEGATLRSARVLEGPDGVAVKQDANLVRWEFPGRPEAGAMEVVLEVNDDFSGEIAVSTMYHRPGMPPDGFAGFQRTEVSENPPERSREFAWMQHMVILSGPETAYSGDVVEYRLDYERTRSTGVPLGVEFAWPQEAASLISQESVGDKDSGTVVLKLRIKPDFTGCLGVGWWMRGTSIMRQIGSVTHVDTEVVAPPDAAALPRAGDGGISPTAP